MNENLFETQYDVTQKSKIRKFYEKNRIFIFSGIILFLVTLISFSLYFSNKEKKEIALSNDYLSATIYLDNNEKDKAINILKTIIFSDNSTYSTLSLFLILNENLITDKKELLNFFEHILQNNDLDTETKNLIIFKKALYQSNFVSEKQLLDSMNPLINSESIWKPHALALLGDYFFSRNEYIKAQEFYINIMLMKGLNREIYDHAKSQLSLISNDQ